MASGETQFRALGSTFEVLGSAGRLVQALHEILAPLRRNGSTPAVTETVFLVDRSGPDLIRLSVAGCSGTDPRLLRVGTGGQVTEALLAELTHRAVSSRPQTLHLHAGAFVLDDVLVVLSGRSGSGKSTFCAAAVGQAATYLTDEVVSVGPHGEVADALARPIRLDALPPRHIGLDTADHHAIGDNVFIPFERNWRRDTPLPDRTIVVTLGELGGPLRSITPHRSAVLTHLMRNSFTPAARSQAGLEAGHAFTTSSSAVAMEGGTVRDRLSEIRRHVASVRDCSRSSPPAG